METIEMLINDLESEMLKAKSAAFSRTDVVVNRATMLDILSLIRENYPMALKEAAEIIMKRDKILNDAREYANSLMNKAEEDAEHMVSESEIVARAHEAAQKLHSETTDNCKKIDDDTRWFAVNLMSNVEQSMQSALAQIQEHKNKLLYD